MTSPVTVATPERHPYARLAQGVGLIFILALPPMRTALESTLVTHMLLQLPLLAVGGWFIGKGLSPLPLRGWNANGIPLLLVAVFSALFWMLPRWLDAALDTAAWEAAKFVSIPLLIGLPLGAVWQGLTTLARGFVWANLVSMLGIIGWLYLAAPVRVCNNYLTGDQQLFGYAAWGLALAISLYWAGRAFFGNWRRGQ